MARVFVTVPDELLEHAEYVTAWYLEHGYTVRAEPHETGFPNTPTLRCRRGATTTYVELAGAIDRRLAEAWARYGRSRSRDTRVVIAVPAVRPRSGKAEDALRILGVGLYLCGPAGTMSIQPLDLAVNLAPPELRTLPVRLRRVLGSAYEQFEGGHWREGFDEACRALEVEARGYLKVGLATKRVSLITATGSVRTMTARQADKLTIGQLAQAFGQIKAQNQTDSVVEAVLVHVNADRVGVVHHKGKAATESRLRKNVGAHMWEIVDALRRIAAA